MLSLPKDVLKLIFEHVLYQSVHETLHLTWEKADCWYYADWVPGKFLQKAGQNIRLVCKKFVSVMANLVLHGRYDNYRHVMKIRWSWEMRNKYKGVHLDASRNRDINDKRITYANRCCHINDNRIIFAATKEEWRKTNEARQKAKKKVYKKQKRRKARQKNREKTN